MLNSEAPIECFSYMQNIDGAELLTKELHLLYNVDDNQLDNETFMTISPDNTLLDNFLTDTRFIEKTKRLHLY